MDVALELSRTNEQGKAKSGKGKLSFLIACGLYSVTALRGNDQERVTAQCILNTSQNYTHRLHSTLTDYTHKRRRLEELRHPKGRWPDRQDRPVR